MRPLVSVVVPVYNVQEYLPKCIDSILAQTYQTLEIILVNDGSTDTCAEICDAYAQREPRITSVHKKNGGLGSARNEGMKYCHGEYLMFVDSDDYLCEDAVQILLDRIQTDRSDMAISAHMDVYEDGRRDDWYCRWMSDAMLSRQEFLFAMGQEQHYPVCAWGKLYRREMWEGLAYPKHTCGEDLWIFPRILARCEKISISGYVAYCYLQRKSSITNQLTEQKRVDELDACLNMLRFLFDSGAQNAIRKWYTRYVDRALKLEQPRKALSLFSKYFDKKEQKFIQKNADMKTKLKIFMLHFPVLYSMVHFYKGKC